MDSCEIENRLRSLKPILKSKYLVKKIGYFGSYAKNGQSEGSDLDILVEIDHNIGWKFFDISTFLEEQLGIRIDLVTKDSLKAQIKDSILSDVKYV